MHEQRDQFITLTQAAKIAPGRPSTNCMWRWCRRGVIARSGQRIKLEHIRMGGKIFTTQLWIDAFGRKLAEADAQYFDRDGEHDRPTPTASSNAPFAPRCRAPNAASFNSDVEREEAGP